MHLPPHHLEGLVALPVEGQLGVFRDHDGIGGRQRRRLVGEDACNLRPREGGHLGDGDAAVPRLDGGLVVQVLRLSGKEGRAGATEWYRVRMEIPG